jgi:NAD(P)H-hydrate epimerase
MSEQSIAASGVPWLSVDQMREVDRIMVEELGISLVRMMENAGRNLAQLARRLLGGDARGRSVVVMAGPGGNGGGGLVCARHLSGAGAQVAVALGAAVERMAAVPAAQLMIVERLGLSVEHGVSGAIAASAPELVIDALLGYSQQGDPHGESAALIEWAAGRRVLALDVPSGLELATGVLRTPHVHAEVTMTLAAPKDGLAACDAVGRLMLADISVPAFVYERLNLRYETPFGRGPLVEIQQGGSRPSS